MQVVYQCTRCYSTVYSRHYTSKEKSVGWNPRTPYNDLPDLRSAESYESEATLKASRDARDVLRDFKPRSSAKPDEMAGPTRPSRPRSCGKPGRAAGIEGTVRDAPVRASSAESVGERTWFGQVAKCVHTKRLPVPTELLNMAERPFGDHSAPFR